MLIGRLLYPIYTLGPGKRLVIWTCGCSKECRNCISPEWFKPIQGHYLEYSVEQLLEIIKKINDQYHPDGVTFSGGDPFEQLDELLELLEKIHPILADVLVYTGYTLAELNQLLSPLQLQQIRRDIAVLIDGRYVDALNDNQSGLIGSTNQNIYYFNQKIEPQYKLYLAEYGRKIQLVESEGQRYSVGIHNQGGNNVD
ncbi:MAG: radical SAM protein [Bifidobacteriaceae bacterium]|nr:radical SAM protein [Bifidobacteriaceae bacterium]